MSNITNELLEKEIIRLREENEKLKDQVEFVCKNREIIQKSYAALEEKYKEAVNSATEINMGILHANAKVGSYPGILIECDLPNDKTTPVVLIEYDKDSGKLQVSTYDEVCDEPRSIYALRTDLKEAAAECRRKVAECEAVLNHKAYREEDPYEVITVREEFEHEVITAREEVELEKKIDACNEFYDKFVKFTGEEV